jgi:hypothetical protein
MVYQRTNPSFPKEPEEVKAIPHAELAMLREIASQDYRHPRSEPESPSAIEHAPVSQPDGSSKVVSNANVLVQRIAALSLEQIENVISDLQELRAFLQSEGERVQQEISSYLKLSQTTMGATKVIADSIPRWKNPGADPAR